MEVRDRILPSPLGSAMQDVVGDEMKRKWHRSTVPRWGLFSCPPTSAKDEGEASVSIGTAIGSASVAAALNAAVADPVAAGAAVGVGGAGGAIGAYAWRAAAFFHVKKNKKRHE